MKKSIALSVAATFIAGLALTAGAAHGAPAAHKKAPAQHQKAAAKKAAAEPGTLGTTQMAGGDAHFGQTYTLATNDGPLNFTLTSAEYAVGRINMEPNFSCAPQADEKLFILHFRVKNPNKTDYYFSSGPIFQTVDANNNTGDDSGYIRRESAKDSVGASIKPGQGIDDLVTYALVPAKGPLSKIIIKYGRVGTQDKVTRFLLGTGANTVKPIPAPYADPSDPSGATPLDVVPAKIGATYTAGFFDFTLDSVAYAPGPFGDTAADSGKRFVVATVTMISKTWQKSYMYPFAIGGTLVTVDDEKTTSDTMLKPKRDEIFDGDDIEPDASQTVRLLFPIPNDAKAKSLKLFEGIDNTGKVTQAFEYDLSSMN